MKKIFYGFLALAGLAMVSCSQEIDEQINANTDSVKKIFTANTEDGASTRTSIALEEQTGNYVVIWNGEEKIAVNGVDYKVIEGAGTKNVTFGADVQGVEAATAEVYNAVYPNTAWVEGGLNLEHLKEQTALNATYGHGYAVTVSTTTKSDMDFKFKNALSFLRVRFSLADDAKEDAITIKTVTITADDYLWGSASDVNYATGEIGAVTNSGEAGKRIVYTAGEDVLLDRGENAIFDAVIAVPVNAEGRTLTIEITGENAWTGTPYTYKAEGVTKKYLRNTVTTLAKAIKPVEVQYVAEGVIRNNEGEWIISSVAGMEWFREQVESGKNVFKGQVVKLGDNIDLASVANFAPISYDNYFEGTFDGQNYTISNLNIARENDWCLGLFGAAKGATFKNIVFENANVAITNSSFAEGNGGMFGLLCGYATGTTTIDNITVNGTVKLQGETTHQGGQRIGTMIGHNVGNLTISNVTVDVEEGSYVSGYCFVGGVIGQAQGKVVVENVKSNIDVKGVQYHAGGLVGQIDNLATLTNCSSSANVSLSGARPIATTINDIARIGGILGGVNGSSTDKVTLTGCTFTGTLSSKTTADEVATVFDCRGLVGRSWGVNGGQVIIDGVVFEHIAGTDVYIVDGVYEIMGKAGMLWFANEVNVNANNFSGKTVKVIADIDMTGAAWAPVGQTGATQFHGTFDGQNKTIKGLTISAPASYSTNYATGLFGWVETGAVIKNIVLDGAAINGYHYVGAIAGYTAGKAKIEGCEVKNSAIVADPNKKDTAGEFNGDKVGGIVGFTNGTNVINGNKVINTTLKGYRHIGGIVGYLYGTAENNSIENVTITVDNSNNYKGYEIQSKYGVNSIAGVMSGTSNNNTGEATIEWGEIPAEKLTAVQTLNKQIAEGATTITLTENIVAEDGESIVIPNGKEVTLDLAGYTISQEMECTASYVLVNNNGTLVIEDSSDAKTGTIIVTDNGAGDSSFGWGTYTVRNSGTLTINGGTIKNVKKAEVAHCAVPLMLYSGKTTINEGANIISANYRTIQGFYNPEVIINGGNFEGQVWMHSTCSADASLTINGGTFAPRGNDGSSVFLNNTNDIKLAITGGYFTTKVGCDDDTKSGVQGAITGGTFTEAAVNGGKTKQLIAEGYAAIANGDGTYTVDVAVCDINRIGYLSLEAALAAAKDGDTINIYEGTHTLPEGLGNNIAVTLKGAGKDKTIVNGTKNANNNNQLPGNYATGMTLVLEDLNYTTVNDGYYGGFGAAKSVTFRNSKIVGQFYCHSGAPHYFYDCTIDPLNGYLYTYASNVEIERCHFAASQGKALQVYAEGPGTYNVNIKDCTFEAAKQATTWDGKPVTAIDINTANGAKFVVNIDGCTATGFPTGLNSGSSLWNNKAAFGEWLTLTVDGVKFIVTAAQFKAAVEAKQAEIYVAGAIDLKDVVLAGYNGTITGVTANAALSTRNFVPGNDEAYQLGGSKITFKNLAIQLPTSIDWIKSGFVHGDDIVFEKCAFEGQATLNGNGNYTFNECEFVSPVSGNYASFVYGVNKAIFNKCAFSGVDRAAKVYATGGDLDIEYKGCTYTSTTTNKAGVEIDATYATTVVYFDKHCSQTGMNGLYAVKGGKATVTVEGTANSGFSADVDGEIVIW